MYFFLPNCCHFDSFASDPSHCSQAPGHLAAFSSAFSAMRTLSLHCKLCPLDCGSSLHSVMDKPNDDSATSVTGADLSAALPRRMLFFTICSGLLAFSSETYEPLYIICMLDNFSFSRSWFQSNCIERTFSQDPGSWSHKQLETPQTFYCLPAPCRCVRESPLVSALIRASAPRSLTDPTPITGCRFPVPHNPRPTCSMNHRPQRYHLPALCRAIPCRSLVRRPSA